LLSSCTGLTLIVVDLDAQVGNVLNDLGSDNGLDAMPRIVLTAHQADAGPLSLPLVTKPVRLILLVAAIESIADCSLVIATQA